MCIGNKMVQHFDAKTQVLLVDAKTIFSFLFFFFCWGGGKIMLLNNGDDKSAIPNDVSATPLESKSHAYTLIGGDIAHENTTLRWLHNMTHTK